MPKATAKPTLEEIRELLTKCREVYATLNEKFLEDEKYYDLDFRGLLNMPTEFDTEGIVLPTARDMVDTCVDHTDIANARVFVTRKGLSDTAKVDAEMMRKFYLGIINRTNVENTISPWRVAAKHYWLHGMAILKTVWDADRWTDKPERNEGEDEAAYAARIDEWRSTTNPSLPIVIQAVHPYGFMPDPYDNGGRFVFESTQRLVYDVKKRYRGWSNPKARALTEKVECISFWTPDYRCELYDDEPILPVKGGVAKHDYGFIPYVTIDSGLGNQSSDNDPVKRYVGILRYIQQMLVSESRNYSISDIVLAKTAWPWFTIEGDNAQGVTEITQKFGVVNKLPPNTKVVPQISQVPPEALNEHLYRTASYIAAHAAPNSVRGMGETGVRSGADRRLLIAEASNRYQYSKEAFKNGTAKVLTNCARLLKNVIPGDVELWARTPTDEFDVEIKKDRMKEPFTCYVDFAPVSEEDEYRRHDDLERLVASHIVTTGWARTQMSNVDPLAMEVEEEIERLKADPAIQQMLSQYGAALMLEAITKRSRADSIDNPAPEVPTVPLEGGPAPQGNPAEAGRRVVPPIPNNAPLGSGQNLQNEMAGMRSPMPMNPTQGMGGGGNR